ncbi:PAS domain-containing protein [Fulvivirgaceae bacterium PWU5]|uniref:histidine kinase n=1 Tax=Dawidia cretensis TaxID=2782350 RepID=A0AAP2DY69_9BACT|nr:CheR family methyltransferase [Dawidia cretensis]MBT1707959.1 PAS domain-containing protein [Dawidia cretensis]
MEQSTPKAAPGEVQPVNHKDLYIVGIGASAGGVQALQSFFQRVPPTSGMAYVVILHLSPDHESKLPEILQQVSAIPVFRVAERAHVRPDHVYVISPNQHLKMDDGHITASRNLQEADRRAPVDIFFRTLAESHGARAICVVLSGTGSNGSMGLKRVKEMGGAAFVQNPREAEYNEMPRHAIATDLVDEVLPVAELPAKIVAYKNNLGTIHIPVDAEKRAEDQQHALREIFSQLRLRTGHDFSNYKRPTLLRRIERRINMRNLPDLPAYAAFITQQPDEVTALLKDLLISVTNFFRDRAAFEVVEQQVMTAIMQRKKPDDQVRIWVAGCATGEEAYSLAMLCAEKIPNVIEGPKIQIFATDIDEAAITFARDGLYSINDAADVSPERLRRFFNKEGDGYRVRREIRETILFANHNFIKDPPFSHLDMISCRNVLIYLNQTAQERVMETFHFALRQGGFLFLGLSESADSATDLYTSFSREFHIFQSRPAPKRVYPVPDSTPRFNYSQPITVPSAIVTPQEYRVRERMTLGDLHQQLLEQYAPPSLVVNEEYEIIHLSERAGRYLQITGGEPTQNLLKMVRHDLRLELRSALYQAVQRKAAVDARGLKVTLDDRTETLDIHIRPVFRAGDIANGIILVVFEPTSVETEPSEVVLSADEPVARQLEDELMRLKSQLRGSIEHHEFQAEELKASNEELQAMNEELRSAAEELETSKEELQSINEELSTVNQELKVKVEEITLANNNLQNLINSVDIGTIFLDRSFRVALFTPPARVLFNLIPNDIGRPLSDITNKLHYPDIIADAEVVLERLQTVEKEVSSQNDRLYMMRVLPYRTEEDRINGVVITFFDITERKRSEIALRASEERLRAMIAQTAAGIVQADLSGKITLANRKFCELLGFDESELLTKSLLDITYEGDRRNSDEQFGRLRTNGAPFDVEKQLVCKDKSLRWVNVSVSAIRNAAGRPESAVAVYQDITERKALEEQKDEFMAIASHELKTPVTSIRAFGEVLQEKFEHAKDTRNAGLMRKMNGQIDRLTVLIRDLLDSTKITAGKLSMQFEKLDINALIAERLEELQRLTDKHTIVFQRGDVREVPADKERIGQVLTNLVTNAVKYSPDGGDINVSTEPDKDKGGVRVTVTDYGIGIEEANKAKIFDRFFRVNDPRVKAFPGMGLGLYISTIIVQRHGGTIGLSSRPGKGSVFHFTLPYGQA